MMMFDKDSVFYSTKNARVLIPIIIVDAASLGGIHAASRSADFIKNWFAATLGVDDFLC